MRSIRRETDGFSIAKRTDNGTNICDFCGRRNSCKKLSALDRLRRKHDIAPTLKSCTEYVPLIAFTSPLGLENFFNTFRLGTAWARRVREGDTIALWDTKEADILGTAEVKTIFSGKLEHLLQDHAHFNHMMLDKPKSNAPDLLFRVLKSNYGSNWTTLDRDASVIFMRRHAETFKET